MIDGQLLQHSLSQPIDSAVTDMEQMRRSRFEHQGAEGAHAPSMGIALHITLSIQPSIQGSAHLLHGLLHRPGFGGAEIIHQKTQDTGGASLGAVLAATDPVRNRGRDALGVQQRTLTETNAEAVLISGLHPGVGETSDTYSQ